MVYHLYLLKIFVKYRTPNIYCFFSKKKYIGHKMLTCRQPGYGAAARRSQRINKVVVKHTLNKHIYYCLIECQLPLYSLQLYTMGLNIHCYPVI